MSISRTEKELLRKSKKIEIEQLKYQRDLAKDQKKTRNIIDMLNAKILVAQKELEAIQKLVEENDSAITSIVINGGNINQINTGINSGEVTQDNSGNFSATQQFNFEQLEKEISKLHQEMKKLAQTDEHEIAVGEILKAKKAAKEKNKEKVYENLKSAGKWALDTATKIGTPLLIEIFKIALNL